MSNETIITLLTALIGALGLKEVWVIWKKKIDLKAKKEDKVDDIYLSIINDLKSQIQKLEVKVDTLIRENVELREEIAKHKISDIPNKRRTKRINQTEA